MQAGREQRQARGRHGAYGLLAGAGPERPTWHKKNATGTVRRREVSLNLAG